MPASSPAKANAPEITRLARTPISRAASKSSEAPRMAMPNIVRRNTNPVPISTSTVTTDRHEIHHLDAHAADA